MLAVVREEQQHPRPQERHKTLAKRLSRPLTHPERRRRPAETWPALALFPIILDGSTTACTDDPSAPTYTARPATGQGRNTPPFCDMWIGISADESAKRCKPSQEAWVTNRYPLRELGLTREGCAPWLWTSCRVMVPKSACF